ncbi:MAG: peptidase and in kexin sedolisin, partial [Steroidobacteraceae bacterium]|nr:peptidase and in kexin sedolisin [Steroidobacteraceae bacterium]
MSLKSLGVLLATTAICAIAGPVGDARAALPETAAAEMRAQPNTWFVQLKGPPTADGNLLQAVRAEKAAFRSAATKAGVKFQERFAYDKLFNGFSLNASRTDVERIKGISNVAAVWPVAVVDAPEPAAAPSPDLYTAISMSGADIA